ncbi:MULTISPECIES: Abi family protein [unclassified Arthrobacter]|uniref:Abi family protein n=1 Tax=unclassified Arthrobacter TaxID=235627 RepID=UPI0011B0DBDD
MVRLYSFDANLRTGTVAALTPIELALRALLGHAFGMIDECAHLKPALLGPRAAQGASLIRRKTSAKHAGTLPV